jgi:malate synthase
MIATDCGSAIVLGLQGDSGLWRVSLVRHHTKTARVWTEENILAPQAIEFLTALQRRFTFDRRELLAARERRQKQFDLGHIPEPAIKRDHQSVKTPGTGPSCSDSGLGSVMLTVPPEREALSRGMASGASVLAADFEDCLSPSWKSCLESHASLREALDNSVSFGGKRFDRNGVDISVRPRSWSREEKQFLVGGTPISASLFDFGLTIFYLACGMGQRPMRALFSLSQLESHHEARVWAEVFQFTEKYLKIPHGFIRVIVAIDTISAASEMDEILSQLRDYAVALESSPLNYVSSFIRSFRVHGGYVLPQRSDITAHQPFLQAYRDLLVHTCRKHGVYAIGGCLDKPCSQYEANGKLESRYAPLDLENEIDLGFDGICVSEPKLVPVLLAAFKRRTKAQPLVGSGTEQCFITTRDLVSPPFGKITMTAIRENVEVALEYIEVGLNEYPSARLAGGMKSMASAELCRAQLSQWIRHSARLNCGRRVSQYVVECMVRDCLASIERRIGGVEFASSRFGAAADLLLRSCTDSLNSSLAYHAYAYIR